MEERKIVIPAIQILAAVLFTVWGSLALWVKSESWRTLALMLLVVWIASACAFVAGLFESGWPLYKLAGNVVFLGFALLLLVWWARMRPSNNHDWMPAVAMLLRGRVSGDTVTLENVRNFQWHAEQDYIARWETRQYTLSSLQSTDLALSYWDYSAVAHAMVSFGFGNGEYLAFSVEVRRKKGDVYSELGGFFRQYELSIVAADERDILRVRTNIRQEDGYLYRVHMPPEAMKSLFLAYLDTANRLVDTPRFYNTITGNCTTIVYRMLDRIVAGLPLSYRVLASGYLPEYLYDLKALRGADSVAQYRRRGRYTDRARANVDVDNFSRDIRRGVPGIG